MHRPQVPDARGSATHPVGTKVHVGRTIRVPPRSEPLVGEPGVAVGILGTSVYLPEQWTSAAELETLCGIPEQVLIERFGLQGKHRAASSEHVTDLGCRAAQQLLKEQGIDPSSIDAVVYFGSTYKNYPVWQAAPRIAWELGCTRAFAVELDYVSCGSLVALRMVPSLMRDDPDVRTALLVGASCESRLLDYSNPRSRFMFNFGDGAVAALLVREQPANQILRTAMMTDGSFSRHVKVPAGGSVLPASHDTVDRHLHHMDVEDPDIMRQRLDEVSRDNFVRVAKEAVGRSGFSLSDVAFVCPIHMKRSMHLALLESLEVPEDRALYTQDVGHLSGVDNLLSLDRLARSGRLHDGDLVLMIAAGTGYTWAATVVRWGEKER